MNDMTRSRGLTLVEILVALVVSAIALTAAVLAARSQQAAYNSGNKIRGAQDAARSALLAVEQKLPLAGYGMDAPLAFDFGWYDPSAVGTCPTETTPCVADKVGDSDELTFYARNPSYWVAPGPGLAAGSAPIGKAWHVASLSGNTLTLDARTGDVFPKGQIVQVICAGSLGYAYVTLDETKKVGADEPTALTLAPTVTGNPFRRQDVAAALGCVATPNAYAKAFLIDRYRFHVRPVPLGGSRYDPFLVLDRGVDTDLDGDVDVDDESLIAEGIESMQVGYVFAESTLAPAGTVAGTAVAILDGATNAPGTAAQTIVRTNFPGPLAPSGMVYESSSFFGYSLARPPAARKTNAQGNIRRVILTFVARAPSPDNTVRANLRYVTGSPLYRQNQNAAPAWVTGELTNLGGDDGYQRTVVETSVALPNMTARTLNYY